MAFQWTLPDICAGLEFGLPTETIFLWKRHGILDFLQAFLNDLYSGRFKFSNFLTILFESCMQYEKMKIIYPA